MTIDTTVTLGNLLTILALIVGALGAWFLLRGDVSATKAATADLKGQLEALSRSHTDLQARVETVRAKGAHELSEYKLLVAREYATSEAINQVEERVVEAINRLGDRFDKYFDRAPAGLRRRGGASHNG